MSTKTQDFEKRKMKNQESTNGIASSFSFAISTCTIIVSFGPFLSKYYLPFSILLFCILMFLATAYGKYKLPTGSDLNDHNEHEKLVSKKQKISLRHSNCRSLQRKFSKKKANLFRSNSKNLEGVEENDHHKPLQKQQSKPLPLALHHNILLEE